MPTFLITTKETFNFRDKYDKINITINDISATKLLE